jgi:hypothetical protein
VDAAKQLEDARPWTVYRQGDDGNRFVVQSHLTREEAERLVVVLDARGHKQAYWAESDTA